MKKLKSILLLLLSNLDPVCEVVDGGWVVIFVMDFGTEHLNLKWALSVADIGLDHAIIKLHKMPHINIADRVRVCNETRGLHNACIFLVQL